MKVDIFEAVQDFFEADADNDPTVCWEVFREMLRTFKKENVKSYQILLDSDDQTPVTESEISKWRKANPNL